MEKKKPLNINEKKQLKAIQNQGDIKPIKKYSYNDKDSPLVSKQKEIFNKTADERLEEITELDKNVNPYSLIYRYKGSIVDVKFNEFDYVLNFLDKINKGKIRLADANNDQIKFKSDLGEIRKGNKKYRSRKQKDALYSNEMRYKARNNAIKFFDDYSSMVSEAKHEATERTGLKILTPKQMHWRLPIALSEVKTGNNSESLLNEIRQIVYCLYQSQEITKKVYNNIIKSIKLKTWILYLSTLKIVKLVKFQYLSLLIN